MFYRLQINVLDFHILNKHKMNTNVIYNNIGKLAYICLYKSNALCQDLHSMTHTYRYKLKFATLPSADW